MLNEIKETVDKIVNETIEASKEAVKEVIWVYDSEGLLVPKYIQRSAITAAEDNPRGWR